jgi:hypothetical protein
MRYIFAAICFFGLIATLVYLGPVDLNGWLKVAITGPMVILLLYSLAMMLPDETDSGKDTGKEGS